MEHRAGQADPGEDSRSQQRRPMSGTAPETGLKRSLGFRDLVLYGIVLIQPTAPMPSFGVIYQEARGHVVTAILLALVAMLFTSISYGRMARAYPHGGSALPLRWQRASSQPRLHHRLVSCP